MRRLIAAVCLIAVTILPACSRNNPPNSLFDTAGYHVRGEKVYYLAAFPGKAFEVDGADPNTFRVLNADFECSADATRAYYRNSVVADADPSSCPPGRAVTHCDETSITFAE